MSGTEQVTTSKSSAGEGLGGGGVEESRGGSAGSGVSCAPVCPRSQVEEILLPSEGKKGSLNPTQQDPERPPGRGRADCHNVCFCF